MYRVGASIDIGTSPQAVWDLLSDPHRYPDLIDSTERMIHVPDEPMGEGYTYSEHAGIGPFKSDSEWTVTEFLPRSRQVHEGDDGSIRFQVQIDIEPTETGSRLTHSLAMQPRGLMKVNNAVMWPLFMRRMAQRSIDRTVANVKAAAEASLST